jgi:hypothetical protein
MPTTNMECYPVFERDVLKRVEEGRPPIANLDDMAATIKLVATAYSMAPLSHAERFSFSSSIAHSVRCAHVADSLARSAFGFASVLILDAP